MLPTVTGEFGVVFEPELRFNDSGQPWVKVRGAAADRAYNPETKQWEQKGETTYLDIIFGGKLAEHLVESITIGDQIVVTGELNQREWTTDAGEKRVTYQLRAKTIGVGLVGGPVKTARALADGGPKAAPQQAQQPDVAPF